MLLLPSRPGSMSAAVRVLALARWHAGLAMDRLSPSTATFVKVKVGTGYTSMAVVVLALEGSRDCSFCFTWPDVGLSA